MPLHSLIHLTKGILIDNKVEPRVLCFTFYFYDCFIEGTSIKYETLLGGGDSSPKSYSSFHDFFPYIVSYKWWAEQGGFIIVISGERTLWMSPYIRRMVRTCVNSLQKLNVLFSYTQNEKSNEKCTIWTCVYLYIKRLAENAINFCFY